MTGRYATETSVWRLGLELDHTLPIVATEFRRAGYKTGFIGKWHVSAAQGPDGNKQDGWIPPGPSRGGFDDLWEGANVLELVSHPNEGNYWDNAGKNIGFKDEYRVDSIANRAVQFINSKHEKPWLLFVSQLEPHHQNDVDAFVPPKDMRIRTTTLSFHLTSATFVETGDHAYLAIMDASKPLTTV